MASTLLIFSLVVTTIYILWVLLKPRKKSSQKKPAGKQVRKKNQSKLKEKGKKQLASQPSPDQIRKQKIEQMKKDPELIGRVVRYWLRER